MPLENESDEPADAATATGARVGAYVGALTGAVIGKGIFFVGKGLYMAGQGLVSASTRVAQCLSDPELHSACRSQAATIAEGASSVARSVLITTITKAVAAAQPRALTAPRDDIGADDSSESDFERLDDLGERQDDSILGVPASSDVSQESKPSSPSLG